MGSLITLGLSEIQVGVAAPTGTMPSSLAKIGKTYQDTCKLSQGTAEVTEHYEEGKAAPEVRRKKKKVPVLSFSIMDPDCQALADYVGGTFIAGTPAAGEDPATPDTWGFDGSEIVSNRAIKVVTEQGLDVNVPNADIEAVVDAEFSGKGMMKINFTVTPLAVSSGKAIYGSAKLPAEE